MTAHSDTRELARCTEAGCTTVIQKPLVRKTLNAIVAKHVKLRVDEDVAEPEATDAPAGVVIVDPDIQDLVARFLEN